jgi:hypothetical protein
MHRSLEASQSHTSNHSRISSRREWERVVNALGCVCPVVDQQQMKGEVRGINTHHKKLVVTMQKK